MQLSVSYNISLIQVGSDRTCPHPNCDAAIVNYCCNIDPLRKTPNCLYGIAKADLGCVVSALPLTPTLGIHYAHFSTSLKQKRITPMMSSAK